LGSECHMGTQPLLIQRGYMVRNHASWHVCDEGACILCKDSLAVAQQLPLKAEAVMEGWSCLLGFNTQQQLRSRIREHQACSGTRL
jgi:hypothetical protein